MIFNNLSIYELIAINGIILLLLGFFAFKWFFGQVREICEKAGGFLIFGQITFLLLSWGCFVLIMIIFIFNQDKSMNPLSLFLTIVVGFLGTIIGTIYSEQAIRKIYESRLTNKDKRIKDYNKWLIETKSLLKEVEKEKFLGR